MRLGGGLARASVVVGREIELEALRRGVRDAQRGATSCVFLVGEGGIGKTRLLTEASTQARHLDVAVLSGRAPIATPVAFSVVADALRSWLRGHRAPGPLEPFDRGLAVVLPEWPATTSGAELDTAQLRLLALEGVVRLVREIASDSGAVLLLDDLHEADPESLEVVRYLANAGIEGLTIIGTMRPSESAPADELLRLLRRDGVVDVIDLAALEERDVRDLIAALLDARPPEPLVADVAARSDGVPLLVEEMLLAHVRAGTVDTDETGMVWRGGVAAVPITIRDLVETRLGSLEPAHRTVLVAGAVIGDFKPSLMTAVADADDGLVADALAAGVRAGVLETAGGAIAFRHAIIREAVLDAAVPHLIDTMHRRAAAALDDVALRDPTLLERRAHHLRAVNDVDEAAQVLAAAATFRLQSYAPLAAEQAARAALDLAQSQEARGTAADTLSRSLASQGRWAEALQLDTVTIAEHGETPERRLRMATSALEAGRPDDADPIIARAVAAGDTSPLIVLAKGRAALVRGDADHALECASEILDVAPDAGDLGARLDALELQGRALDFLGDRGGAEATWTRQAEEAAAAGRTQAQLRAVVLLGKLELFAGRPPQQLHVAVELARDAGALVELSWAEENLAIGLALHGDVAGSQAVLSDAIARCRALRLDQLAYLLVSQAVIGSYTTEDVEGILDEAETLVPTQDLRLHSTSVRADIALRRGRYSEAVQRFETCLEIMRAMPGIVPIDAPCWMVWAYAAAGQFEDAVRAVDEARAWPDLARWYGRPIVLAAAEALVARDESGIDRVLTDEKRMPMDVALMHVLAAQIIDGRAKARWLRDALDAYESAGAVLEADRVRKLLREAGGTVPRRRRPQQPVPTELSAARVTAREAEVLRLLGDGLSNADIAQRLFVSVRTVEFHVSSLLSKMAVRNRGQLTALSASIDYGSTAAPTA